MVAYKPQEFISYSSGVWEVQDGDNSLYKSISKTQVILRGLAGLPWNFKGKPHITIIRARLELCSLDSPVSGSMVGHSANVSAFHILGDHFWMIE